MSDLNPNSLLLKGVSQFDVDFVIPRYGVDIPLGIDPFLLFKSRDPGLAGLHAQILQVFDRAIEAMRIGNRNEAQYILDFPEPRELGLGYTARSKKGSGVGEFQSLLLIETLEDSSALIERGLRHIEELQLISVGIGPDRISDITANIIKQYLVDYTQKQCRLWDIPIRSGIPLAHIFDPSKGLWYDDYVDLPLSPLDSTPMLFVPRRIVRTLPWINYGDYYRKEFEIYLRAKRIKKGQGEGRRIASKSEVVSISRTEIERIDRYIDLKEANSADAQPSLIYLDATDICQETQRLKTNLQSIPVGRKNAAQFQKIVLEILNLLFSPELIDGKLEVSTLEGTERRDIIFVNDSDKTFWSYLRNEHSSLLLMIEVKNTQKLVPANYNQVATYLGDRLGRLGFIVARVAADKTNIQKAHSIYNDSNPRKVILTLSDFDLLKMLDMKCKGDDPMRYIQTCYRNFRQNVQ